MGWKTERAGQSGMQAGIKWNIGMKTGQSTNKAKVQSLKE
jgi:hypothetical protein